MALKGIKQSKEHVAKRMKSRGNYKHPKELIEQIVKTRMERIKSGVISPYWKGKHRSEETKEKIRKYMLENPRDVTKCIFWKGGIDSLSSSVRKCWKYREWRDFVFKRDNYTCQECGEGQGNKHAHHIKSFSLLLKNNNISSEEQAILCEQLWDINNGITLCVACHKLTDSYLKGGRPKGSKNKIIKL